MSLESTTSEESTTSSREGLEEHWYQEENHVIGSKRRKTFHQPDLTVNDPLLIRPLI